MHGQPVQDIIVGNIPGAHGPDTDTKPRDVKYTSQCITDTPLSADKQSGETVPETDKTPENKEDKSDVAIETRAMVANEKKPPKPLNVNSVPDEIKTKQKEDESLKKYWDLAGKPIEVGKPVLLEERYSVLQIFR